MSKLLKYYYDFMSQPSRALWIALKLSNTPYDDCPIALRKGEHLTDTYKEINRFQKVPCIVDGDFHLAESVSIVRYLASKGQLNEKLYPKELQVRARVDEFLEWHHLSLRLGLATYFLNTWLYPLTKNAPRPTTEQEAALRKNMQSGLELVERIWLNNSDFLTGNQLTIADLFGACEIEQTKVCEYHANENDFPKVIQWLARVREASNPCYDEAHKFLNKTAAAFNKN